MLILLVLVVGFGVAAFVVSRGNDGLPAINEAQWCGGAEGLIGAGPTFTGEAEGIDVADLDATRAALFDVETIAPYALRPEIGALADFTIIATQELADLDWPAAYVAARENKVETLDAAIEALDTEMRLCGHDLG